MSPPIGAMVYKDASLTVDGTEYANQLNKARLVPEQSIQTMRTLVPDGAVQDVDSPVWTLELAGFQINIAGGLAAYLRGLPIGQQIACVLQPKVGVSLPKATFTAIALATPFGGDQGAFLPIDLTLPVLGSPVFT